MSVEPALARIGGYGATLNQAQAWSGPGAMRARIQGHRAALRRPPKPPADPRVKVPIPVPGQAPIKGEAQKDPTHTAVLGLRLEEKLRAGGDEVHLVYPGHKDPEDDDGTAFLIAKLKRAMP